MAANRFIFVGFELDDEMLKGLENCKDRDRVFLEDPTYLEQVSLDSTVYIGKRMKDNASLDRVEDTSRSVVSLLSRLLQGWSAKLSDAKLLSLEEMTDVEDLVPVANDVESV